MRPALLLSVAVLNFALPAAAQPPRQAAAPAVAAPVNPQAVVAEVRRIIAERYVLPERRPALDAVLAEGLSSGRYSVTDPAELAGRINADLERVGRDRHLNFNYSPEQAALAGARNAQAEPDQTGFERQVRRRNHGVAELRVLPGNIRYMDYRGFDWIGDDSRAALNHALQFLKDGDAIIIDLRRNGGGSPEAVQHIVSHFMEANRPLMTFYMNGEASPDRTATLADLPVGRMIGKPLYVLTSSATGSAAEEFTGHVAGYRLGEIVGGNTGGAGFRNELVPIAGQFMFSVSVGRAVLAATGRDWEAVGHAPTIPTPVPSALDVAHAHALRRLADAAPPPERVRMIALAEGLAAKAENRTPALPLESYAGSYGERTIVVDAGRLYYQRGTRPRELLVSLGGNRFAFDSDPGLRLDFAATGERIAAVDVTPAGLPPQRIDRTR
jgi:hypothetical protein